MRYKLKEKQIDLTKLPAHIAIIMDGNGRWAQKKGMHRYIGHQEGVVSVRNIVETSGKIGIKYLTLYAFSTENWNRPQDEVNALLMLMVTVIQKESADLMANNVRLLTIGDTERLPESTRAELNDLIKKTSSNTGLTLVLAISYSSRWEITEMAKKIAAKVKEGSLEIADITENTVSGYLSTKNIPDPDLLIRTGGEYRISNFLMWQLSYSELYFTDVYWPEFREENLYDAILDYQKRERRFGKTGEQVKTQL
ncbi:MAG: isoprenyl transferase [Dysgonamonadaceae bacterium]|jgi:undecaprenyl diphosphate synthase|nr:isoprenyl transferase [Dysgonamonadaceae bacterium]